MSGPDWLAALFLFLPTEPHSLLVPALFASLFASWVILSSIPALLLSATDEQSCLMPAPALRLIQAGTAAEAIQLVGTGNLIGLLLLAIGLPLSSSFLLPLHRALAPHFGWMLWSALCFMALSQRPRPAPTALSPWRRIAYTLTPVLAGLSTLILSGVLGMILFYRSPVPLTASILTFTPAIIGLFAMPGLLLQLCCPTPPANPMFSQNPKTAVEPAEHLQLLPAITSAFLPGCITVLVPPLTGAIGALLTHHLVSARNARTQLVAHGIARMLYYGAGLFLLFLPGSPRMRSSSAALIRTFYEPAPTQMWLMVTLVSISAFCAWAILPFCAKGVLHLLARHGTRPPALISISLIIVFVVTTTSWPGLLILLTATGIGLIPILFRSSPINGIGVVLIPLACALTQ